MGAKPEIDAFAMRRTQAAGVDVATIAPRPCHLHVTCRRFAPRPATHILDCSHAGARPLALEAPPKGQA